MEVYKRISFFVRHTSSHHTAAFPIERGW